MKATAGETQLRRFFYPALPFVAACLAEFVPLPCGAATAPVSSPSTSPASLLTATLTAPMPSLAPSTIPTVTPGPRLEVSAHRITYDADRSLLVASGKVSVHSADGSEMHANYFSMDLKANRYLLAGHVRIDTANGVHLRGAALANFLDFARSYYLPIANGPDRWTFVNGDFLRPLYGRENPGDAFALPDESKKRPFLSARSVVIVPHKYLRFNEAMLDTGVTVVPVPEYSLNLSANPNFAQNSLAAANFDASYPFFGSKNASTVLHFREGATNGIFAAIEQRFVGTNGYVVGSISPLDKEQKQYNLLGSIHPSKRLQIEGFAQESAFQQGFAQPLNASAYLNGRITQALPASYLQLSVDQYYQSLLGRPTTVNGCTCAQGNAQHAWIPNHPINVQLSWTGFDQRINRSPLHYRLRSNIGFAHDRGYGFLPAGTPPDKATPLLGAGIPTITHRTIGLALYTSSIRISRDKHGNDANFNATFDMQKEYFSLPHHIDTTNSSVSLSKAYGTKVAAFLAYTITNIRDDYGSQQSIAYAQSLPGFNGFGTLRNLSASFIYTPNPNFNVSLIGQRGSDYYSTISKSITANVHAQVLPHLSIDLSRIYYFGGVGAQHGSPAFSIHVGG